MALIKVVRASRKRAQTMQTLQMVQKGPEQLMLAGHLDGSDRP